MKLHFPLVLFFSGALGTHAQVDLRDIISKGYQPPTIAVPDFRGTGEAQGLMAALNGTLFQDLQDSGFFKMASKSLYPVDVPQQPQDLKPPVNNQRQGPWLTDWSNEPVKTNYLTIGYAAVQNGRLALFGWLFNVNQPDVANAQLFSKIYFGDLNQDGAKKVGHEFAADILAKFGLKSLYGTKIYYTKTVGRNKEIWVMDFDGSNQKPLTRLGTITRAPAVSADATRMAFTTFAKGNPSIMMMSLESGRYLPFLSPQASMNSNPEFTATGKMLFASTAHGKFSNIYICNLDGTGLRRIAEASAVEVEPKVNPKTGAEIVLTSGRSGTPQIYKMSLEGADVQRLTTGEGDAVNPSWHPNGQHIAFSWTRGYDPGNFNIFVMDVASREYTQLTHGAGRNEYPSFAPDGLHLVFTSTRTGSPQIWTMLANGTQERQLTHEGRNENPVWSK